MVTKPEYSTSESYECENSEQGGILTQHNVGKQSWHQILIRGVHVLCHEQHNLCGQVSKDIRLTHFLKWQTKKSKLIQLAYITGVQ